MHAMVGCRSRQLKMPRPDAYDSLDLGDFLARYDKDGPRNQPLHPAMMVKVLVYGYATDVFSSRKIARKLPEDLAFRVLAARNFPDHYTIRALHLKELSHLFLQVVRLAREMGQVKLSTIAVDGAKVKANASRHKAISYGHMLNSEAELKSQIDALMQRTQQANEAKKNEPDGHPGRDRPARGSAGDQHRSEASAGATAMLSRD